MTRQSLKDGYELVGKFVAFGVWLYTIYTLTVSNGVLGFLVGVVVGPLIGVLAGMLWPLFLAGVLAPVIATVT